MESVKAIDGNTKILYLFSAFVVAIVFDLYFVYVATQYHDYIKWIEICIFTFGLLGFYQFLKLNKLKIGYETEVDKITEERNLLLKNQFKSSDDFVHLIESHFKKWDFSESEKVIALYLLKGKSVKEISEMRNVVESTIRNQCHNIYSKSGLGGKHELASFFLQQLFSP